jgi:hypothetical protein
MKGGTLNGAGDNANRECTDVLNLIFSGVRVS